MKNQKNILSMVRNKQNDIKKDYLLGHFPNRSAGFLAYGNSPDI